MKNINFEKEIKRHADTLEGFSNFYKSIVNSEEFCLLDDSLQSRIANTALAVKLADDVLHVNFNNIIK
jgi:hypothetical protein